MPPHSQIREDILGLHEDAKLDNESEKQELVELEERNLKLDVVQIYNNLRYLDYSKVVWRNVLIFVVLHTYCAYGIYLAFTAAMWKTLLFSYSLYILSGMGITMGAHRLWSHKSFKAKTPLRVFLMLGQTLALQNNIYQWCRDHRVHHKYSETDADPHNAKRGLFFAHMGWLMYKKHPDVINKGKNIDMSDLAEDPVIKFQRKYYWYLGVFICFVLPTVIPWYFWEESVMNGLFVAGFMRYVLGLHITWMVNSLAHWVGGKPYDITIYPVQNRVVSSLAFGEGWHNYHHTFPFDYRAAEWKGIFNLNVTTNFIEFFQKLGQAYDLKTVDHTVINQRKERTGPPKSKDD